MSKKDYVLLANLIKETKANHSGKELCSLLTFSEKLIEALGQDNPRFNKDRFRQAATIAK